MNKNSVSSLIINETEIRVINSIINILRKYTRYLYGILMFLRIKIDFPLLLMFDEYC